jgi:cyclopropane fatty-acyl-phospholipid synthase-like methyltransferase
MRIGLIPESAFEQLGLWSGEVPTPVLESFNGLMMVRSLMAVCRLGLLEALADGPLSSEEVARRAGTSPMPTRRLLDVVASLRYLSREGEAYALTPAARRWLLAGSPESVRDYLLWRYYEWDWVARLEDHVRTGSSMVGRPELNEEGWRTYQRAMLGLARLGSNEIAARTSVPRGAAAMLDIGGAHGFLSVAFCRRHPGLKAVVLELPEAVQASAPLLAEEGMGDRVVHRAGDALVDDLGEACWDVVVTSSVVHHFTAQECGDLTRRVARALKPGGVFAVIDFSRPDVPGGKGQTTALMDLYFGMTSVSGAWTADQIATWQREAGLVPRKPLRLRRGAGSVIQAAVRPG